MVLGWATCFYRNPCAKETDVDIVVEMDALEQRLRAVAAGRAPSETETAVPADRGGVRDGRDGRRCRTRTGDPPPCEGATVGDAFPRERQRCRGDSRCRSTQPWRAMSPAANTSVARTTRPSCSTPFAAAAIPGPAASHCRCGSSERPAAASTPRVRCGRSFVSIRSERSCDVSKKEVVGANGLEPLTPTV